MGIARANCYAFLPEAWCLLEAIRISLEFMCCLASIYYFFNLYSSNFTCILTVLLCIYTSINLCISLSRTFKCIRFFLHCFSFPNCLCVRLPLDRIYHCGILNHLTVSKFYSFLETSAPLSIDKDYYFFNHLVCKSLYCSENPGLGLNNTFNMWFILHFLYVKFS